MGLTLTRQTSIKLEHPYSSPTESLTLNNPILESSYAQNVKHINRVTRGLRRKVFKDADWPHWMKLFVICQNATLTKLYQYQNFIAITAGEELKYTDQDNLVYRVILFPGEETRQYTSCGWVIKFELEGTRV
jgi:hypothetical protein